MTELHICSSRPGYIRGGMRHPAYAAHHLGTFTDAQLADIVNDPALTVIVGSRVSLSTLALARAPVEPQPVPKAPAPLPTAELPRLQPVLPAQEKVGQQQGDENAGGADEGEGDTSGAEEQSSGATPPGAHGSTLPGQHGGNRGRGAQQRRG